MKKLEIDWVKVTARVVEVVFVGAVFVVFAAVVVFSFWYKWKKFLFFSGWGEGN